MRTGWVLQGWGQARVQSQPQQGGQLHAQVGSSEDWRNLRLPDSKRKKRSLLKKTIHGLRPRSALGPRLQLALAAAPCPCRMAASGCDKQGAALPEGGTELGAVRPGKLIFYGWLSTTLDKVEKSDKISKLKR